MMEELSVDWVNLS